MPKIKIGVIFGGQSTEHDVSIVSGSSILKNLNKQKYEIYPIYINKEGIWYHYIKPINEIEIFKIGEEPKELEKIDNIIALIKKQEIIFPVLHGLYGEDGTIQGLMELLKVPYVGNKVLSSSICMDKVYAKIIFEKAGLNQAKYIVLKKNLEKYTYINDKMDFIKIEVEEINKLVEEKLKYPVFIKPSNSGSSIGVSKAETKEELIKSIKEAEKYDNEILIEEGINAKEVECAVIGKDNVKASTVGQILSAEEYYDYNSKYKNAKSETLIPADISDEIAEKIKEMAIKAFKAVKGEGLARVDFFVEKNTGKVYINEINTMPGFTQISMYPKLWEYSGLKYAELLDQLIELELK